MADGFSNYGTLFEIDTAGFTEIGDVLTFTPPTASQGMVETTHHSSGGFREFISDNLSSLSQFSATILLASGGAGTWYNDIGEAASSYRHVFPDGDVMAFSALTANVAIGEANSQSPDKEVVVVTFQPTGPFTFTA